MHEFGVAESLLDAVQQELDKLQKKPRRVVSVTVAVGALAQVMPEQLQTAWEVLSRNTPVEGSDLRIVNIPVSLSCRKCGNESELEDLPLFVCPSCGSATVDVEGGQDLFLQSLEVEYDDE